jgi:hypothetical protein
MDNASCKTGTVHRPATRPHFIHIITFTTIWLQKQVRLVISTKINLTQFSQSMTHSCWNACYTQYLKQNLNFTLVEFQTIWHRCHTIWEDRHSCKRKNDQNVIIQFYIQGGSQRDATCKVWGFINHVKLLVAELIKTFLAFYRNSEAHYFVFFMYLHELFLPPWEGNEMLN